MPFINVKTNIEIKDKEKVKAELGRLITMIPNKTEARTMVELQDNRCLYFGGTDEPCAIIETLVNAGTDHSNNKEYGMAVIDMIHTQLQIPEGRIYTMVDEEDYWFAK